jgi:aryl-alcohol dehydrogenase-like predicted oxidoreductase
MSGITKRAFLHIAASSVGAMSVWAVLPRAFAAPETGGGAGGAKERHGIPYRPLGTTGEYVSAIGIGGFHMGSPDEETGIRIVRTALDRGINFLDNCWDYHDGRSEERMGRALRDGYRDKAFLMTKIDGRTKEAAARQIDDSLRRLQTDRIDLMQFHEVIRPGDPDRIYAAGGALEAMYEAQKAGKVRFIGFTGHKSPDIHLKMLLEGARYGVHFATVQMPLNVMDAHFESFEKKVLPQLVSQGIGVLGMKPLGGGFILKSGAVSATECLHYALNLPTSVVVTGCESMKDLDQAIAAVKSYRPMDEKQVAALLARTAKFAQDGKYERYKVSQHFDGTAAHPEWLG